MPTARPVKLIGGEQSAAIRVRLNDGASTAPSRLPTRRRARGAAQPDGLERRGARDLRPGCSGARAAGGITNRSVARSRSAAAAYTARYAAYHDTCRGRAAGGLSPRVLVRRLTYSNPVHLAGVESSATMAKGGGTRMSEPPGHARNRGCRICSRLLPAHAHVRPGVIHPRGADRPGRHEAAPRVAAIVSDARRASRDAGAPVAGRPGR